MYSIYVKNNFKNFSDWKGFCRREGTWKNDKLLGEVVR
jgi:hypothetical protein